MMQALLTLTMDHSHFNNGPFPFQQWTIFILTMVHSRFNNGPLFG